MWDTRERREYARAKIPIRVKIFKGEGDYILTYSEDISLGGVRVVLDEEIDRQEVNLELNAEGRIVVCKGLVAWISEMEKSVSNAPSRYDIGIKFLQLEAADRERIRDIVRQYFK